MSSKLVDFMVHERTLLGAVDSYLKRLVRVRPHVAAAQSAYLEAFAERWIEDGGSNSIEALSSGWLSRYLASVEERQGQETALRDFFSWLCYEGLLTASPLDHEG